MPDTTLKNKASFVIPSVGTTNSNEVIATVLQFNVIKKQNSVTTPINVQTGDTVTYIHLMYHFTHKRTGC